jgi:phage gpG-like protein
VNIQFSIDVRKLNARLGRMGESVDPAILTKVIGARLNEFVDESFRTKGRGKWVGLAPSTLEISGPHNPLQLTGKYKQSFTIESDNRTYVLIGSNHPLAIIHEEGTGIWGPKGSTYTIRIKNARVLAAKAGGGWKIFGTAVEHTGVPDRPVLPTKDEAVKILIPVIEQVLTIAARSD